MISAEHAYIQIIIIISNQIIYQSKTAETKYTDMHTLPYTTLVYAHVHINYVDKEMEMTDKPSGQWDVCVFVLSDQRLWYKHRGSVMSVKSTEHGHKPNIQQQNNRLWDDDTFDLRKNSNKWVNHHKCFLDKQAFVKELNCCQSYQILGKRV